MNEVKRYIQYTFMYNYIIFDNWDSIPLSFRLPTNANTFVVEPLHTAISIVTGNHMSTFTFPAQAIQNVIRLVVSLVLFASIAIFKSMFLKNKYREGLI